MLCLEGPDYIDVIDAEMLTSGSQVVQYPSARTRRSASQAAECQDVGHPDERQVSEERV